ncbi:MAG: peptidylprolyl isomerase [Novosphingobium sp.]
MNKILRGLAPVLAAATALSPALAADEAAVLKTPAQVVAAAPQADWKPIAPSDLLVMDLAPDGDDEPRRVVIQLMPAPFSQGWVENIRKLAAAHWFDGIAVVRVQDNYVVQWGDPESENPDKAKPLPEGLKVMPESDYVVKTGPVELKGKMEVVGLFKKEAGNAKDELLAILPAFVKDGFPVLPGFKKGWPVAVQLAEQDESTIWPVHCYGSVGVGRNVSPDTGTGAELYAVIGHAPRQLDRNIAVVGRVIAGIELLSSLPRGTGELGFYETPEERTPIVSVRMGDTVPDLPAYEYLATESASFAAYAYTRANRKDAFYIQPAGGVDVCNAPVPIREVKP